MLNLSFDDVMWKYSWVNLVMLASELVGDEAEKKDDVEVVTPMEMFKMFN